MNCRNENTHYIKPTAKNVSRMIKTKKKSAATIKQQTTYKAIQSIYLIQIIIFHILYIFCKSS